MRTARYIDTGISSYPMHTPPPEQPRMPPWEQPCMPPRATTHAPPGATMYAHPRSIHTHTPRAGTPSPGGEHTGKYGQRAGGMHPTGMQSCCNNEKTKGIQKRGKG